MLDTSAMIALTLEAFAARGFTHKIAIRSIAFKY
jgi:hypothetical protein